MTEHTKHQRDFWNETAKYQRFVRYHRYDGEVTEVEEQMKKILEEFPNVRDMTIPKSYSKVYVKPKEDIITGNSGRGMAKGGMFLFKAIAMRDGRRYLVFRPNEKSMSLGKMGNKSIGELFCKMENFNVNKNKMEFIVR